MQRSQTDNRITTLDILEDIGCTEQKAQGNGYFMVLCPFHEETNPSLQVNTEERRGRPEGYAYCYGCGQIIRNPVDLVFKLLERKGNLPSYVNEDEIEKYRFILKPHVEKTFEFKDLAGNVLYYQEIIYNPAKGKKEAKYYRIDEKNKKIYGLKGIDPIPWGLHTYNKQTDLFVFESPQDAEAWLSLFPGDAVFATCGATHWQKFWSDRILPELKRRGAIRAILVPQNDPASNRWLSLVFKKFKDNFDTYICWIAKNKKVKDFADIAYRLEDGKINDLINELKASLSKDLPLLWKLELHDKYMIDLESNLTLKVQKEKLPVLFPFVVYPSKLFFDAISNKLSAIEITYIGQDGVEHKHILKSLTNSELSKISFFSEDTLRAVAKFLDFVIHANMPLFPTEKIITKTGWKDSEFICPLTLNCQMLEGPKLSISSSSEKEAIDNIKWMLNKMSESQIIVPVLFGLITPYMETGCFLELIGPTTTGKTFTLEITSNLFGYEQLEKWWGTANAIIERFTVLDRYPIFLDEIHLINREDLMFVIYSLTSGQSKARLSGDARLREIKRFTASILSSGEKSIADISEQLNDYYPGGLTTRSITIQLRDQTKTFMEDDKLKLEKLKDELRSRSEKSRGWLVKLWFDNIKDWITVKRVGNSHVRGVINGMYEVANKLYSINLITKSCLENIKRQLDDISLQSDIKRITLEQRLSGQEEVKQFFIENMNKFVPKNILVPPDKREVWGWTDDPQKGVNSIYVMKRKLKEICISKLKLSPDSVIKEGLKEGWITNDSVYISYLGYSLKVLKINLSDSENQEE